MLIAGDIGGTKTDLAIFSTEAGPHAPLAESKFRSADYPNLEAILQEFLHKSNKPIDRACLAVAGPVIEGRVKITNLPWVIDEASIARKLNINRQSVRLINDLEAIARAVPILRPSDVRTLNAREPVARGTIAVIAPGTGLGEAFLTWEGTRYVAHSSEGGHSDFAPTDVLQVALLQYMFKKFDHVSFEHVCSGIGIPHIYAYLRDVEGIVEDGDVAARIAQAADPSVVIINEAADPKSCSRLCGAAIEMFVSILAAETGNLAVKFLATGGIYIAGGVAVHTLGAIEKPLFLERFMRKGRFAELMGRIPIHVILTPAGLSGAAACGLESPIAEPAMT